MFPLFRGGGRGISNPIKRPEILNCCLCRSSPPPDSVHVRLYKWVKPLELLYWVRFYFMVFTNRTQPVLTDCSRWLSWLTCSAKSWTRDVEWILPWSQVIRWQEAGDCLLEQRATIIVGTAATRLSILLLLYSFQIVWRQEYVYVIYLPNHHLNRQYH